MPTYRELRHKLMKEKNLSKQALSALVQKKRKQLPMSAEDATCIIAHEKGLKIHKFLSPDKMREVQKLQSILGPAAAASGAGGRPNGRQRQVPSGPRAIRFANGSRATSSLLTPRKLAEAREMAALYPVLYMLENSMREVVRRVMRAKYGNDWFDKQLTSGKAKTAHDVAISRMQNEQRWHQRRGADPLDYLDLGHLGDIMLAKQTDFFPHVLGHDLEWFKQYMKELEPTRNVLCHMNPVSEHNAQDLITSLARWEELVKNAGSSIPPA